MQDFHYIPIGLSGIWAQIQNMCCFFQHLMSKNSSNRSKAMMKFLKKSKKTARYHWRPAVNMSDRAVVNTLINPIG